MSLDKWIQIVALVAGIALPLFNIPLIMRIIQRKTSNDFSLSWAIGVWVCIVLMTPQAIRSQDLSFKVYGYVNIIFFTAVVFFILKYRSRSKSS